MLTIVISKQILNQLVRPVNKLNASLGNVPVVFYILVDFFLVIKKKPRKIDVIHFTRLI
ncbi:hypothetical protein NBRC116592_27010 [Colwellia sp. KU-HH00111]